MVQETIVALSDDGGATRPLSTLSSKGRRPVISCETRLLCIQQQFQASCRPTLFTHSMPKFVDLRRNGITHIQLHSVMLVTSVGPFEILQGMLLERFLRVPGLSLTLPGSILAHRLQLQPWINAVLLVLGDVCLLWKSNGLRCVVTNLLFLWKSPK